MTLTKFCLQLFMAAVALPAFSAVPAVVKIYDEEEVDELLDLGVEISRRRGDILLCLFPDEADDDIFIPNGARNIKDKDDFGRWKKYLHPKPVVPQLDKAVNYYDAYTIGEGSVTGFPLTGKGVVAGFCDIGFDPLHPTFLDEEGHSRVKRITQYRESEGFRLEIEGDEAYREWKTDNADNTHATHVGGIMAGNGGGTEFIGAAPQADIVVSVSELYDYGLLMGVEDIIDYAKEHDKKAVINLSMGSYTGAHDGSSLFSQYLDMCADDALIVLSAGNEGAGTNSLQHVFTAALPEVSVRIGSQTWRQTEMYGLTDVWSGSSAPLTLTLQIYDDESYRLAYSFEPMVADGWELTEIIFDPENPVFPGCNMEGWVRITGGLDMENGRYNVAVMYEFTSSTIVGNGWAKDVLGFTVSGPEGEEVQIFADVSYSRLMNQGPVSPSSKLSISDLACGERVISVGMYGNRREYPVSVRNSNGSYSVSMVSSGAVPLEIYPASSYGVIPDGRALPVTVAPGAEVMSSMSRYFWMEHFNDEYYYMSADAPWVVMSGTSMSSPYVAGYLACLLEAYPSLDSDEALSLMYESNTFDIPDPENPRNPNGYFNPVAALRILVGQGGVDQLPCPDYILMPDDYVEVWTLSGIPVYKGNAEGCNSLRHSVYILKTPFGSVKRMLPGLIFRM